MNVAGYLVADATNHMLFLDRIRAIDKAAIHHSHPLPLVSSDAVVQEILALQQDGFTAAEILAAICYVLDRLE